MVDAGPYILSLALLAAVALPLGYAAVSLRRRLLPAWEGAPAHLVDAIVGIALLIWLSQLLGTANLLQASTLVSASLILAAAIAVYLKSATAIAAARRSAPGEKPSGSPAPLPPARTRGQEPTSLATRTRGQEPPSLASLAALAAVALTFALWGLTAADALGRGMFNFDSLWYHMPFAVEMAQSHSVTGLHYTETVFTNWFYPQNSELLHAVAILLSERDTLSLFLNFGWLALAFLAAWCIGRPYGLGPLTVVAAAILLASHTLVVREPGAAKNDIMAAALLLAAIAILVNAWAGRRRPLGPRVLPWGGAPGAALGFSPADDAPLGGERGGKQDAAPPCGPPHPTLPTGEASPLDDDSAGSGAVPGTGLPIGWPTAAAGLAVGLAAGTKVTVLAMAAALSVAVLVLAPAGRRRVAAAWWFLPALAGGGYWYLRNLIVAGNPLPQVESIGPVPLPHPESLQSGRPDFSVAHYATDTGVWREYFGPGLEHAFGLLWPLVVGGAILGALLALLYPLPALLRRSLASGRGSPGPDEEGADRTTPPAGAGALRWIGAVTLLGLLAYVFTPLSAAGPEGDPAAFRINLRFAIPALLAGLVLLPLIVTRKSLVSLSPAGGTGEGCRGDAASSFSPHPQARTAAESSGEKASGAPAPLPRDRTRGDGAWSLATWALLGALLLIFVVTDRADAALRDPDRLAGWLIALLFVLVPTALLWARFRGAGRRDVAEQSAGPGTTGAESPRGFVARQTVAGGFANRRAATAGFVALALLVAAIGYPVQRGYLEDRFANASPDTAIPGMDLDSAYRWARDVEGARIGLAGTTAGFLQHGFYGTDLSNRVRYLGAKAPRGAFHPIPTCSEFRAAVNAAALDFLVTAPFLNFIEPSRPIPSPEARWLRGDAAATPIDRSGPVTVWRIDGPLDPSACGPANAPLRAVPQQPSTKGESR